MTSLHRPRLSLLFCSSRIRTSTNGFYKVQAYGDANDNDTPDGEEKVRELYVLVVAEARFEEDVEQSYGYDDFTNKVRPWKSILDGATDSAYARVITGQAGVAFDGKDGGTIEPPAPAGELTKVTVGGPAVDQSSVVVEQANNELAEMGIAAYPMKTYVVGVRLVHKKASGDGDTGYQSQDVSDAEIRSSLNDLYIQAIVEWDVRRFDPIEVAFDLNGDGMLDFDRENSPERTKIRIAGDDDSVPRMMFLVSRTTGTALGWATIGGRHAFISTPLSSSSTISHEMGHTLGMNHTYKDAANVMRPTTGGDRFRKNQWDFLHSAEAPAQ